MKKKHLLLLSTLSCVMPLSALAQNVHPSLELVASKINTKAEYVKMNKVRGDLTVITQYLELALNAARKSGKPMPANLKAASLMEIMGLNTLKAYGDSSEEIDNAWLNHSYLENGGSKKGIFSLFGATDQDFIVPHISPAGTDVAMQLQVNLSEVEVMVRDLAKAVGKEEELEKGMKRTIPKLGITASEFLSKMDVRVNLMLDMDDADAIPTPFGNVGRPFIAARVDGVAWLWEAFAKQAIKDCKAPVKIVEKDSKLFLTLTPEALAEMTKGNGRERAEILKLSPVIVIDQSKNQVWLSSNKAYLDKCMSGENTLAESSEFKSAVEGLATKANSMAYVSQSLLGKVSELYGKLANTGMFGSDFDNGKAFVDRLMEDITESDKGWVMTVSVDTDGILTSSRGPVATKHLEYLSRIAPIISSMKMNRQLKHNRDKAGAAAN